jgi:hypothetical protein
MRHALILCAVAGMATTALGDVLITEVVDGDLAGGNPKFVELCNTGPGDVTFGVDDFVKIYFNGGVSAGTSVSLDGVTISAGTAIVIASSSNNGDVAFQTAYGLDATIYTGSSFGNGDDVYTLEGVGGIIDTYGPVGVDGTGENWEYTDSYAYRDYSITSPNATFTEPEWVFGGVKALDGPDDPTRIALLQQFTSPFVHVPTPGAASLLAVAGLAAARRRRA